METNNTHLLFVYGTLKRGHSNHHCLEGAEFVMNDYAPGHLYCHDESCRGVPVVIPEIGWVRGELYRISDATLKRCDHLEGHPNFYTRTTVQLRSGTDAFIYYMMKKPWGVRIKSGEWNPVR